MSKIKTSFFAVLVLLLVSPGCFGWSFSGGEGGKPLPLIKTGAYTAPCNSIVLADTTGGAFTITLPASPPAGCTITIVDAAGNFATANLTVSRNSLKINGLSEDLTLNVANGHVGLVYYNATYGWRVLNY